MDELKDKCFPEHDTRVLTNHGFLFLSELEERLAARETVLYACYDESDTSIVYAPGKLVYVEPPTQWVDFTHAGTRRLWDSSSDDHGRSTVPTDGGYANRLTLRTTPEHDMYVQLCTGYGTAQGWRRCRPSAQDDRAGVGARLPVRLRRCRPRVHARLLALPHLHGRSGRREDAC